MFAGFCLAPNIYLLITHFKANRQKDQSTPEVDWPYQRNSKLFPTQDDSPKIQMNSALEKTGDKLDSERIEIDYSSNHHASTLKMLRKASDVEGSDFDHKSLTASLYESRVTYKYRPREFGDKHGSDKLQNYMSD